MDVAVVTTDRAEDVDDSGSGSGRADVVVSSLCGTVAVCCCCDCDREERISAVRCRFEDRSEE